MNGKYFWKEITKHPIREEIQNYQNLDCIFIYDEKWRILNYFFQINNCRLIKFIQNIDIKSTIFNEEKTKNKLILIILKKLEISVTNLIKFFPEVDSYNNIKTKSSLNIYYLYSNKIEK